MSLSVTRTQRIVEDSIASKRSALAAKDEELKSRFVALRDKQHRNKVEEKEYKEVHESFIALLGVDTGLFPAVMVDKQVKPFAERLREELVDEFGEETPLKRILIDRLVCAWGMSYSYERMFKQMKYQFKEDGRTQINFGTDNTNFLKEVRRGIESANNQIIRLSETLRNLNSPPIQVKATNAFFAHNQQINQHEPPKDLEKISVHHKSGKISR